MNNRQTDGAAAFRGGPVPWIVSKTVIYRQTVEVQIGVAANVLLVTKQAQTIEQFVHRVQLRLFPVKSSEINS
jgi:hypothetical protein